MYVSVGGTLRLCISEFPVSSGSLWVLCFDWPPCGQVYFGLLGCPSLLVSFRGWEDGWVVVL